MIEQGTILPCDTLSDEGHRAVAVIGHIQDFAVYQYFANATIQECADHGDKIGEDQARRLFPELKDYIYRR